MQVDHIELYVPDREQAAQWYQDALGLHVVEHYRFWADEGGPLIITTGDEHPKIALFQGPPQNGSEVRGLRRLAFRVSGARFLEYLDGEGGANLGAHVTETISRESAVDHAIAWSIYFSDPWGTLLEITTYDDDLVRPVLRTSA